MPLKSIRVSAVSGFTLLRSNTVRRPLETTLHLRRAATSMQNPVTSVFKFAN